MKSFEQKSGRDFILVEDGELDSILFTVIEDDDDNCTIALDAPQVRKLIKHLEKMLMTDSRKAMLRLTDMLSKGEEYVETGTDDD